ncbi:hypothetical protein EDB19DRAFT_1837376 [Suillus lakei]|nr:hypothetical protein EDB19DRAFT_1837376 [Suillus lakei]
MSGRDQASPVDVSNLRSLLINNATLADISRVYNLPTRLRVRPAQAVTLRASLSIQADVLESYMGGLYLDQDLPAVEPWLTALFASYATEAYNVGASNMKHN